MKQELVEKVARELFVRALVALWNRPDERPRVEAAWDSTAPSERELAHNMDFALARYALALAERAADEAVSAYRRGEDGVLTVAVERAVEGA